MSKILATDYIKILRKEHVYNMHQGLQNIIQEHLQHEYNKQVDQPFEKELNLIREQEQKEQEKLDQQRKQALKQEAQYFAINYK